MAFSRPVLGITVDVSRNDTQPATIVYHRRNTDDEQDASPPAGELGPAVQQSLIGTY